MFLLDSIQLTLSSSLTYLHAPRIRGKPGAGKSTLMRYILGQLRKSTTQEEGILLSFFFNARGCDLEKTTMGLYRSLLLQLLKARPSLQYILERITLEHRWTIESLKSLFEEAVQGLGSTPLVCVIDALDECDQRQIRDMVSFLSSLGVVHNGVRICFASRHYPRIITMTTAVEIVLELQNGHSEDIVRYIKSELKVENGPLADEIRTKLRKKSSGIFMWVSLVVDILNQEDSVGRQHVLLSRIEELPKDLHELFREILIRNRENIRGLLLCLQWLLFAKQPLTVEQLYLALVSGLEPGNLPKCHSSNISYNHKKSYILNNSKGLAETTRSKKPTVQLIHESVRDFLLKEGGLREFRSEFSTNVNGESHDALKKGCIAYINMHELDGLKGSFQIAQKFPFLNYANQGVLYHAEEAQIEQIGQQNFLAAFPLSKWIHTHNIMESRKVRRYTPKASLLYILAEAGMSALIRAHSWRKSCFEKERERYGLPILAACATDSTAAVETMLELEAERLPGLSWPKTRPLMPINYDSEYTSSRSFRFFPRLDLWPQIVERGLEDVAIFFLVTRKPNVDARDRNHHAVLNLAVGKRFVVLTRLLLKMGANVECDTTGPDWGPLHRTPLPSALYSGNTELIELLINHRGVNISAVDIHGKTALSRALSHGHTQVAELLINRGINILAVDCHGQTALFEASRFGNTQVAELLIKRGADLSSVDYKGNTVLHEAADNDKGIHTARLLIDRGANVMARNGEGATPLHRAACSLEECECVARLLLERGADLSARTIKGETPLHLVSRAKCAEVLLHYGADVSATTIMGETPLHSAAYHQDGAELASLLLEHGADILATNARQETPLHIAINHNNDQVARILRDHWAVGSYFGTYR
ncbi:ankyrin repeat-containing domain protein [Nemania serpens]|nr:ankyrin repeat-containing domain protein [Nemania serpens]